MGKKKLEEALEDLPVIAEEIGLEADELPALPVEPDAEEAAVEPADEEPVIIVPTADLVFDADVAECWLNQANFRLTDVYAVVRFDAITLTERRTRDAIWLAARAVKVGGELFIPTSLLDAFDSYVEEETFFHVENIGNYAAFRRAI